MSTTLFEKNSGKALVFCDRPQILIHCRDESCCTCAAAAYVWTRAPIPSYACTPDGSLMSANVSQRISECERCRCYSSGRWWDDTICHCSDGFSIPQRGHVQALALKGCLCVSHSLTLVLCHTRAHIHGRTHTHITLLELTTKTCLSNCGGIRLGYKETHKANVSISCSSESLFVWLIRTSSGLDLRCCFGNDAHKTPQCDVDMFLNNRLAFWLMEQSSVE